MKLACTLIFLLLALSQPSSAKDWAALIAKLERQPQTPETVQQIAVCSNNLALEYERKKDWNNAERWMKKAYNLDRSEKLYQKHLGDIYAAQAYELYSTRESRARGGSMHGRAKLLAQRALSYNRSKTLAHIVVGRIEYDNHKMLAARRAFRSALKIDPDYPGLAELLEKVERELKVEKKFGKTANSFFDIRFATSVDARTAGGLRYAMETARDVVGRDYNFRPKHKTVLLVYSTKEFTNLKLGPHWAGGVYDGKIRLPLDGEHNLKYAVSTLFHEYAHALHDDLARSQCPRWLDEGLAEIQGQKIVPGTAHVLNAAAKNGQLVPLDLLSVAFRSEDTIVVSLAYEQSHSLAKYMVKKYGYRRIRKLMNELGNELPLELAMRKTFNVSMEKFESQWKASLAVSKSS